MRRARTGQVAIYLIMILVVIFMLALLNVDSFIAVRGKNRVQNAGDAAALAAARKQGALLNEIGRRNLEHVRCALHAVTCRRHGREEAVLAGEEIVSHQRRCALLRPLDALREADRAARKNGMDVRPEFAKILEDHVRDIRLVYAGGENDAGEPYPEPFPGAWTEYATALENVIAGGLAVGPDNIEFYDAASGHPLLWREFYHAIAGRNWCWFHFNPVGLRLLENYNSWHDWGPLPTRLEHSFDNCEIFSLHVVARKGALTEMLSLDEIKHLVTIADIALAGASVLYNWSMPSFESDEALEKAIAESILSDPEQVWFFFNDTRWSAWFDALRLAGDEDGVDFPIVGDIKPEYNVRGCAAICRSLEGIESFALEGSADLTWSAAAKPFGTVENMKGEADQVIALSRFVVPSFSDVRLVPLDSVGGENLATADYGWVTHVRRHLKPYLQNGPGHSSGCFYCDQLKTWERDSFRRAGVMWLKFNSGSCIRPTGGGGSHGGTSHGH